MKSLLVEAHYLPSLEYFCLLQPFEHVQLDRHEHYVKQSFRNRCYINTANGVGLLTVPLTAKHGKVAMKDVRIDYSKKWQNNHWRTIESAYRKAPFFEHYAGEIERAIYGHQTFLFDLNVQLLSFCLQCLKWEMTVSESVSYEKIPQSETKDFRNEINAKKGYQERPFYHPTSYYQIFGNRFAENLSLIDLLFCEGPRASHLISLSRKEKLNN